MRKFTVWMLVLMFLPIGAFLVAAGCHSNGGPSAPFDTSFSPTPTVSGPIQAEVVDKGQGVSGVLVCAIPPSGVPTYTAATTTTGIATFNPGGLQEGNWTFVIPAQTPFPYAPSTLTMAVTAGYEQATFNSAGATLYLTPTVPEAFTSTNPGTPFTFNLIYSQPGSLLVPVNLSYSGFPNDWQGTNSPVTLGYGSADTATVMVTANNCVDLQPDFTVSGLDLEPTPYPRAQSSPQTITKSFTSNVTVTWATTGLNSDFCDNGDLIGIVYGTINVSSTNACSSDDVVSISLTTGNCCYSRFQTPNGSPSATNCGGGSVNFGPGSYNCTIDTVGTWGVLNSSFKGQSNSVAVPLSGSVQLLSVNY